MVKRLVAIVVLGTCPVGCSGRPAIAGGAATAATGGLLFATGSRDRCPDGGTACEIVDEAWQQPIDRSVQTAGIAMILVGAALMAYGLGTVDDHRAEPPPPAPLPVAHVEPTYAPDPPAPARELPAEAAIRSRMQNQLAIQVSVAARRGDCAAALATGDRLAQLDPALHDRLVARDASYQYCRDQRQRM
ncbi:MAG TPA: hypothetical protein VFQ53_19635 [Kofleriaceae bacterium]|nr:hypothetical protein [Kofleriaceae bacterium]